MLTTESALSDQIAAGLMLRYNKRDSSVWSARMNFFFLQKLTFRPIQQSKIYGKPGLFWEKLVGNLACFEKTLWETWPVLEETCRKLA